ncbi:MAG: two-component system, OmpR family, response regulator PfeR [Candidatus Parcubacteria bacterium]|nr:two-component system, OmpR family, response regulator PfeR [Candidatus Parcubacteria bacterium]
MIIVNNAGFGEAMAAALKKDDYENVFVVSHGAEGLKSMYDILPHLILLDVTLPGLDGYQILEKKMAEKLLAKIPIFLLSTEGVPINMQKVPTGSVVEFIMALHADPAEIVTKVDRHFSHEASSAESPQAAPAAAGGAKKKLLWIEDDKLIGTILSKKFLTSGFDLFHAKNGEEALEALKTSIPDVIAVDLILPGMSGFEILTQMNLDERIRKIPKMVLSNLSKPADIEKARSLGAQKFLVKAATSLDQIVAEVRSMIK